MGVLCDNLNELKLFEKSANATGEDKIDISNNKNEYYMDAKEVSIHTKLEIFLR